MSTRVQTPRRTRWLGDQSFELHDRPFVPHPYDDEFDGPLGPEWQLVNFNQLDAAQHINPYDGFVSGGVRLAYTGSPLDPQRLIRPSWLRGQNDQQGGAPIWVIRKHIDTTKLGPNFLAYCRMSFTVKDVATQTANDSTVGFGFFGANDFNNCVFAQLNECNGNDMTPECGTFTNGSFTLFGARLNNVGGAGTVEGQHGHTMAISCLGGTTFHCWMASAAGNWLHIGSGSYSAGIHYISLFGRNAVASGNSIQGFDYIRFRRGRFLP